MKDKIHKMAIFLHETYEDKARLYGWTTQDVCRVPFNELPEANSKTMLAVAKEIIQKLEQRERELEERLESKEFYELMQFYRHIPVGLGQYQIIVTMAFENVKKFINSFTEEE